MRVIIVVSCLLVGALFFHSPATAADETSAWIRCDGAPEAKSAARTWGRALLAVGTLGLTGIPPGAEPWKRAFGQKGVDACTEVLAAKILQNDWLRHANLLRARAIHNLEADNYDAAISDIETIPSAIGTHVNDPGYTRTLGLSVKLLEGIARAQAGQSDAASRALVEAAKVRPYSVTVQTIAIRSMPLSAFRQAEVRELVDRLVAIEPEALPIRAVLLSKLEDSAEQAADDWKLALDPPPPTPLVEPVVEKKKKKVTKTRTRKLTKTERIKERTRAERFEKARLRKIKKAEEKRIKFGPIEFKPQQTTQANYVMAALTAARVNRVDDANLFLSKAKAVKLVTSSGRINQAALLAAFNSGNKEAMARVLAAANGRQATVQVEKYADLVSAILANHAGQPELAIELLESASIAKTSPFVLELVENLRSQIPPEQHKGILAGDLESERAGLIQAGRNGAFDKTDLDQLFTILPIYENPSRINQYSKQWRGFKKTGFKDRDRGNDGSTIEFMGNKSALSAVEEMNLLRAAELAQKNGSTHFLIADRRSYRRTSQTTYNGVPIGSPAPAGFRTELDIIFIDPENVQDDWQLHTDRILSTEDILASLMPQYASRRN